MKVFLATDGSECALRAEQEVATFPFAESPSLTIATVCPSSDLHNLGTSVPETINEMIDDCRQQSTTLLKEAAERCLQWAGWVETRLLDGHPAHELLTAMEESQPDFAVMGAHGYGAVKRFFLGSVSERMAKHASCSVMVVRPHEGHDAGSGFQRILVAYDGSDAARAAVQRFSQIPLGSERTVHLLAIVETAKIYGMDVVLEASGDLARERKSKHGALEEAATLLGQSGAKIEMSVVTSDNVAHEIDERAKQYDSDLIVIGGSGKSAWTRFLMGSASLKTLHHAPCSVWIERSTPPADS